MTGTQERVVVSKNGSPVAVILAVEDYPDPTAVAEIRDGKRVSTTARRSGRTTSAPPSPPVARDCTSPLTVVLSAADKRAIERDLPEAVAAAVVDFLSGPLATGPHRVGTPLRLELRGLWSVRRGQYRVIYSIHDQRVLVRAVRISHRADVYRT